MPRTSSTNENRAASIAGSIESSRLRVLFFSYAYPNLLHGSLGTFNQTMIAALSNRSMVQVVSPVAWPGVFNAWRKGIWNAAENRNLEVVTGVPADYVPYYYPPKVLRSRYHEFMWWSVRNRLQRTIDEFGPTALLSYWAHPDGAVAARAAHANHLPCATIVGGSDVLVLARKGRRRDAVLNSLRAADMVLPVSDDIRRVLLDDGFPAEKLHVMRRGVDREIFSPGDRSAVKEQLRLPRNRPLILGVGRLETVKNWPVFIEACRLLKERRVDFVCRILGNGALRADLEYLVGKAGLQERIKLGSAKPQRELADWYRAADVTLLTSDSEGVPNVLLESICCGSSFVASNVGGIPEIADPAYDQLCPAGDPAAFADALERKLSSSTGAVSPSSRRFVPMSVDESADDLSRVLRRLANAQSGEQREAAHEPNGRAPAPVAQRVASPERISLETPEESTRAAEFATAALSSNTPLPHAVETDADVPTMSNGSISSNGAAKSVVNEPAPSEPAASPANESSVIPGPVDVDLNAEATKEPVPQGSLLSDSNLPANARLPGDRPEVRWTGAEPVKNWRING